MVSSVLIVAHLDLGKSLAIVQNGRIVSHRHSEIEEPLRHVFFLLIFLFCLVFFGFFFAQVYSTLGWLPSADMRLGRVGAGDMGPWWEKEEGDEGKEGWEE